jgi:hypothetical protein
MTKTELAKIIKEEVASILQEQDPIKAKEKILADLKAKIKAEKDPKKKKKLQADLKKKKVDLAAPSGNADQGSLEEGGGGYGAEMMQQQVDSAPEVQQLRPMLEAIPMVKKVFIDDIKESKSAAGHKLISVQLVVPSTEG